MGSILLLQYYTYWEPATVILAIIQNPYSSEANWGVFLEPYIRTVSVQQAPIKFEHGRGMIYAGVPSFLSSRMEEGRVPSFGILLQASTPQLPFTKS